MTIWITVAVIFAVPIIVQRSGGGIVALLFAVASLYGLGIVFPITFNPPTLRMVIFATTCLVFWLLSLWSAPFSQPVLKTLFWMLHLSFLAAAVGAMYLSDGATSQTPEAFPLERPAPSPLRSLKMFLVFTSTLSLMGFAAAAFWSVMRKLKL